MKYNGALIKHTVASTLVMMCYHMYRVVYEGPELECVIEGCTTEGDIVHQFRVAAINAVGRGPYSMPVTFTQRKACRFNLQFTGSYFLYRKTTMQKNVSFDTFVIKRERGRVVD